MYLFKKLNINIQLLFPNFFNTLVYICQDIQYNDIIQNKKRSKLPFYNYKTNQLEEIVENKMKAILMKIYKNSVVQIVALAMAATVIFGSMGAMVFMATFPKDPVMEQRVQLENKDAELRKQAIKEMQTEEMKQWKAEEVTINCEQGE